MYEEQELLSGTRLGREAADRVTDCAGRYCERECERIALLNEPRITMLQAEGGILNEARIHIEDRLGAMSPPGDERTRKRRTVYYAVVAVLLTLAGVAFTIIGFGPFRLGRVGLLYCLGIGIVTPFAVDEFLKAWNAARLVKTLTVAVFLAAILGGGLLAAVRGDLLLQRTAEEPPVVVIDDGSAPKAESKPSFYEKSETHMRILMLLFAFAIDLGAGIAWYRAQAHYPATQSEYDVTQRELTRTRERLLEIVYEMTHLTNAPAAFAAEFWRDFYRGTLTQTVRQAITKGISLLIVGAALVWHSASAENHVNVVTAIDLSASQSVKGPEQKTPFERNIEGMGRLLGSLPAGSRVTILGITKNSIAVPAPILSARLTDDAGYFGERLAKARANLVSAWRSRVAHFTPDAHGTDIIGVLHLMSEIFSREPRTGRNVLVIFSDMRNVSPGLNLEARHLKSPSLMIDEITRTHQVADLAGVTVYVAGANGGRRSVEHWRAVQEFWMQYFAKAGAKCGGYSMLVEGTIAIELK
jgi:hypothetical protein